MRIIIMDTLQVQEVVAMIRAIDGKTPRIDASAHVFASAEIYADVTIGADSSVWSCAVVRGDVAPVRIGCGTNVQEGSIIHVSKDIPAVLGDRITVGHGAILHSCTIGDGSLIGMGAIVLDGAVVGENCMVAAGALVPPGKRYPSGTMIMGSPAKAVRELTQAEIEGMHKNTDHYVIEARTYRAELS